jgi:hypothetical protein
VRSMLVSDVEKVVQRSFDCLNKVVKARVNSMG